MKLLYCNLTSMNNYNGTINDSAHGGGEYAKTHIPHEVNNFTNHNGHYYGFVQSNHDTIDITAHYGAPVNAEFVDDILVVFIIKKKYIVGYYKHARVYRKKTYLPDSIAKDRVYSDYNLSTDQAVLIPTEKRNFKVDYPGRINIWYGNEEWDRKVSDYIETYDKSIIDSIKVIDDFSNDLQGIEKETVIKQRVNQSEFRNRLIKKNSKCCICGVTLLEALIASHIKPWTKSDSYEKLSQNNGLLLCPNHDKLFDIGYISFDDDGKIIISEKMDENNRIFLNVNPIMKINPEYFNSEMKEFMKYHRDNIFKKNK